MKKTLISLLVAFVFSTTASAQNSSEHLTFKGVPIDGTLSEYVQKMKQAGFIHTGTQDGTAILTGDFAGYKGCTIGVSTLKSTNNVNAILVIFPEWKEWASLENNYANLKSMLTEKYGEPSECMETFQGYHSPKTDMEKFISLTTNQCTWYTTFSTPKGDIQLSLDEKDIETCFVILRYFDKINTDFARAKAMDDL